MGRPHLSPEPTILDRVFESLRVGIGAKTDVSRAVVASTLFVSLFIAILLSPLPSFEASLPLAAYGVLAWFLLMVIEWDGPNFQHGRRIGKLPEYLFGLTNAFSIMALARLAVHGVIVCTLWKCRWAAFAEHYPVYSVRVMAGSVLCIGAALMQLAKRVHHKGAGVPYQPLTFARPTRAPRAYRTRNSRLRPPPILRRIRSEDTLPPYSAPPTPSSPPPYYSD